MRNRSSGYKHKEPHPHLHPEVDAPINDRHSKNSNDSHHPHLHELYTENICAKIFRTAMECAAQLPDAFPELVPQHDSSNSAAGQSPPPVVGKYQVREADFWTCGFFPGTLYALLERSERHPRAFALLQHGGEDDGSGAMTMSAFRTSLLRFCEQWSAPLRPMATRTDTHDIGFIVMPALRRDWEMHRSLLERNQGPQKEGPSSLCPSTIASIKASRSALLTAARSLASRFLPGAGVIRSWDLMRRRDGVDTSSLEDDAIVIIDSMCNLDLLYYAADLLEEDARQEVGGGEKEASDQKEEARNLRSIATRHAEALLTTHLRPEPQHREEALSQPPSTLGLRRPIPL